VGRCETNGRRRSNREGGWTQRREYLAAGWRQRRPVTTKGFNPSRRPAQYAPVKGLENCVKSSQWCELQWLKTHTTRRCT
jgi:hypothetical protein